MKQILLLILLAGWITAAGGMQQGPDDDLAFVKKIAANILNSKSCTDNLYFLTKKIGGRMAGSEAMGKAEQWAREELVRAGADTVWLQPCKVNHWERGGKDSAFISFSDDGGNVARKRINVAAMGNSSGGGIGGVKGKLLMVDSFEELEKHGAEAASRIIFFGPKFREGENSIGEYSRLAKYRTTGATVASGYGAKGIIVRSLTGSIDDYPHTGGQHNDPGVPGIPAVCVSTRDANFIEAEYLKGKTIEAEIFTHGRIFNDTTGHNVIGELKGWEFPDRYITIGGHLDSWDVSEGTSDDGTGVVLTIEILRALKETGYRPRHTIRFVLFADEENGINGALAYAAAAKEKNEVHVFALESDSGCFPPFSIGISGLSSESEEKLRGLSSLFEPYKGGKWLNAGGADIGPLNQNFGTPMAALWSDQQSYFTVHHSTNDTYETTDPEDVRLGAVNLAIMLYLIEKYQLN